VNIQLSRKHVIFRMEGKLFFSRLIDSEYIDYQRVIPKAKPINVKVDRMGLISSLERASLVTEDKALGQAKSYVRCAFEDSKLKISSVSVTGSVYDELGIEKEGDNIVIGFNCRYLLDALKAADGQIVNITLNSPLMSIVITPVAAEDSEPSDEDFLYMVCPVKMKE
jgi:DNA polymerase-3 subunit beta